MPDFALGSYVAPLGIVFYQGNSFPRKYRGGAFIGMHGSWNRSELVGYKVVFVPFKNGTPKGEIQDFLTGFIADEGASEEYGRPVDVAVLPDGWLPMTGVGRFGGSAPPTMPAPPNRGNGNPQEHGAHEYQRGGDPWSRHLALQWISSDLAEPSLTSCAVPT